MALSCGISALVMGALSFVAAIIRGAMNDYERSNQNEMIAIGWFILAALCFR